MAILRRNETAMKMEWRVAALCMAKIVENVRVAEDPDALWREIGQFGGVGRWRPLFAKVERDGEQKGAVLVAEGRDGSPRSERLLEIDPARRLYRYRMEQSAMPVRDYVADFRIDDSGERSSTPLQPRSLARAPGVGTGWPVVPAGAARPALPSTLSTGSFTNP
jgi:hypothetical protein